MRPLVAVRRVAPFDSRFLARSPLFWPLERAATSLGRHEDFPPVDVLVGVFQGDPPVRFVNASPRRRRGAPVDARSLYDARITLDRQVPTRAGCWHDLMNALVWGTFPRAKRALHARQHRSIGRRISDGARQLPGARTPELDALALLDEGGVVVRSASTGGATAAGPSDLVVFGHAIYESLVLGVLPAVVAGIALPRPDDPEEDVVGAIDRALALTIEDDSMLRAPNELRRVPIGAWPAQAGP
jgi:hypothetical protein